MIEKEIKSEFKKLEKKIVKYLKSIKKPYLEYSISVNIDSSAPNMINYTLWITPIEDHYKRHDFVANTFNELNEKFDKFATALEFKNIAIDYHNYEILRNEDRIQMHKDEIEKILSNQYEDIENSEDDSELTNNEQLSLLETENQ